MTFRLTYCPTLQLFQKGKEILMTRVSKLNHVQKQTIYTYPIVLALAACCTNTGRGAFIFGTSESGNCTVNPRININEGHSKSNATC